MKIVFDREALIEAMTPAMSAVSEKNTITQLEGILFTTEGSGRCILSSYDLEKGYRCAVEARVLEQGSFIINAAKLFRMVKMMPESDVKIEVNDRFQTKISSGNSIFSLSAMPGADFPKLPDLEGENGVELPQRLLKKMLGQVQHAIALTDQRPIFSGAYFCFENDTLRIVACDGNRLALREKKCALKFDESIEELSFIVPGKTLSELTKMLSTDEEEMVKLQFGRKHVIFKMGENVFFSRLIEGKYIDYQRVIPKNNNIKAEFDREELIDCLERVSLVTEDKSIGQIRGYVKCMFEGETLKVSSASSVSSVFDELPIKKDGEDITIGFNCRFLLDALRVIEDERVRFSLATPLMSILIEKAESEENGEEEQGKDGEKKEDDGRYLYVVSPVKMKE